MEGQGVAIEERFSSVFARHASCLWSLEVLNGGQIATQPLDYLGNLHRFGLALHPSIVIVTVSLCNDLLDVTSPDIVDFGEIDMDYAMEKPRLFLLEILPLSFHHFARLARRTKYHEFWPAYFRRSIDRNFYLDRLGIDDVAFSAFCSRLDASIVDACIRGLLNPSFLLAAYRDQYTKDERIYSISDCQRVADIIAKMQLLCLQRNIKLLVLIIPDISQIHPDHAKRFFERFGYSSMPSRVRQLAMMRECLSNLLHKNNIAILDTTPYLAQAQKLVFFPLDQHLNPLGHRMVADALLECSILKDWLAVPPRANL